MKLYHMKQEIRDGNFQLSDPAHMMEDNEEMIYLPSKSSRNDVIEYNPAELSLEDSDGSGIPLENLNFNNFFLFFLEISQFLN